MRGATCAVCHAPIVWRRTKNKKWTPDNLDGTSHWATCTGERLYRELRDRDKREAARAQLRLGLP